VLGGDSPLKTVVLLAVFKIIATTTCYSSGNAGGIFGPSLFIGAMIGGAVGTVAHNLLPALTANPGAYALVGMGAAFAGIVRTPLTSVIMIFELTRDYSIVVPLMISNVISFFISQRLQREPIYEALALQEGVFLPTGESRAELAGIPVSEVMQLNPETLPLEADMAAAKTRLNALGRNAWPVASDGRLYGVVTLREIESQKPGPPQYLRDILSPNAGFPHVHADHPVSLALERMGSAGVDAIPVVSRANIRQITGIVTLPDILAAYGVAHDQARRT
jgi:CIC family chloride channel protein